MKKLKKFISCITILSLVASLTVGCGAKKDDVSTGAGAAKTDATNKLDTSKSVELNLYLMGDAAKDNAVIMAKLNELTKKDLNCTVKATYSTWTDFQTKYNLMLTSGQNMDLVYSASWLTYATYAKKGAFLDLTNLIPKYAPILNSKISKESWEGVKVDDKIYAVPNQNPEYVQNAFIYREDLRLKYNLPEISSVDTIEQYLTAIKKNEKGIMPTNDVGAAAYDNMFLYTTPYELVDDPSGKNLVMDPKSPHKLLETVNTPEFKPFVEKMKLWADLGFWSKSALSSTEDGVVSVETGKAAASFNSTLPKAKGEVEKIEKAHPDWKIGVFEYNRIQNKVHGSSATQNLTVIPTISQNPERALALIDKLQNDKEYYDLMQYGIKDLTYNLTADGRLDYSKIDTANHTAPSSWAWTNKELAKAQVGVWSDWENRMAANEKLATLNVLDAFVLDTNAIQSQYAAVNQVKNQYGNPLMAGLVKDVDKSYETFKGQLKAAGFENYRDNIQKQLDEYLNKKGIK
ncbi:MAG: ABC transporter substrate-binding protein [Clostridium sp.]|uniref:ABC transporter substrate-binding protein n=1 Tax=Clostridium sp. TaxID=1506 RepID=UPI003D6D1695